MSGQTPATSFEIKRGSHHYLLPHLTPPSLFCPRFEPTLPYLPCSSEGETSVFWRRKKFRFNTWIRQVHCCRDCTVYKGQAGTLQHYCSNQFSVQGSGQDTTTAVYSVQGSGHDRTTAVSGFSNIGTREPPRGWPPTPSSSSASKVWTKPGRIGSWVVHSIQLLEYAIPVLRENHKNLDDNISETHRKELSEIRFLS